MSQKYHKGDLVQIDNNLGIGREHFPSGKKAIVIGSYKDQYGGKDVKNPEYTLFIHGEGEHSWYQENVLTFIKRNQYELLDQWEYELKEKGIRYSDINWIFENGPEVLEKGYGASIARLAREFGITNMWGNNGENFVWYTNAQITMTLASKFLQEKDKEGFLKATAKFRKIKENK